MVHVRSGSVVVSTRGYAKWAGLVSALVRHCVDRYAAATQSWLWELWYEPDITYWRGTPQQFFELYEVTATALRQALPQAQLGLTGRHRTTSGAERDAASAPTAARPRRRARSEGSTRHGRSPRRLNARSQATALPSARCGADGAVARARSCSMRMRGTATRISAGRNGFVVPY